MRSFLHNSFVIVVVWNFLSVSCRPQGSLFSIDSFNNDPFTSPSNDINFFVSDEELDNLSTDVAANPTKLNFNSDLTPIVSDSDVGTEPDLPIIISDDLFSTTAIGEEYALDSNSLLCEMTDNKLINDDNAVVQQLQIRDGAASSSSCPANQPTAGQSTKPSGGIDDEGQFKFDEFLRSRPKIPTLFKEVFQICPPEPFGLSNIPVCDNPEFQSLAIPQPGQDWVTLHDVLAYLPLYITCLEPSKLWCCREVVPEAETTRQADINIDVSQVSEEALNLLSNFLQSVFNAYFCYPHN